MNKQLHNLGFSEELGQYCQEKQINLGSTARVVAEHRGIYRIKNDKGEFSAKITGRQMYEATSREDYPAVGDWIMADFSNDPATIQSILPRKTVLRKTVQTKKSFGQAKEKFIATNIDIGLVVEAVDRDFNLNRIERYCAIALDGDVQPAIILNKTDLISPKTQTDMD
jgi:ribosome biogenesis GTPase